MNEFKKNNTQTILIVILTTISALSLGYIALDKTNILSSKDSNSKKEVKKENKVQEKETTRDLTQDEINILKKSIEEVYNTKFASYYPLGNLNTISNQKLLMFAHDACIVESTRDVIQSTAMDNIIARYFGDFKVQHEDIICTVDNIPMYKYDSATNTYTYNENHPGHGGADSTTVRDSKTLYLSGTVKDEKEYTINMKVLYGGKAADIVGPNNAYYKSYSDTTPVVGDTSSYEDLVVDENTIKNIQDKLPTTTYTFIKDQNDNYGLKSVTIQ